MAGAKQAPMREGGSLEPSLPFENRHPPGRQLTRKDYDPPSGGVLRPGDRLPSVPDANPIWRCTMETRRKEGITLEPKLLIALGPL